MQINFIPLPNIILKGNWSGTVYAYTTRNCLKEIHIKMVDESVKEAIHIYNYNNYESTMLIEEKRELVYESENEQCYMTLVQFKEVLKYD